jgi:hypothetical protein
MDWPLTVIVVVTAAALCAGLVITLRAFKRSGAPATPDTDSPRPAVAATARHDHATTELLKRFFDGKACAICKRPIPPVHRTGLKPGLFDPTTHETHSWDEIPDANLSTMLETRLPLCPECRVAESFRQRFPNRAVDRERVPSGGAVPRSTPAGS